MVNFTSLFVSLSLSVLFPLVSFSTASSSVSSSIGSPSSHPSFSPVRGPFSSIFPDCSSGPLASFPICSPSASPDVRVSDLLGRYSLDEKMSLLGDHWPAINRLGLPAYEWWSEALHGVAQSPGVVFGGKFPFATSFPMPIGLAAAFNRSLIHSMASFISQEARAFSNAGQAGLTYFTPNINIFRDPRWGRGKETPGEDPYTTAQYVYQLVKGLQEGEDSRYLKIVADCKHYNAYDLENWNGVDRHHFNAVITDQDLVDTLLPAFESCIRDARVASIMCSYNEINGIPSCANTFELQKIARESFQLDGFVVSDCDAIDDEFSTHHYTSSVQDSIGDSLHAGCDLNCGSSYAQYAGYALGNGTIVEADIDLAVSRLIRALLRLGYFDPPETQPYRQYGPEHVNTPEAQQLALEAARQSIVLLKNNASVLPFSLSSISSIALIGPSANATDTFLGNYNGIPPYIRTIYDGLVQHVGVPQVVYQPGCQIADNDTSHFDAAAAAAAEAEWTVFVGGLDGSQEDEGTDRTSIDLPGVQWELVKLLAQKSKNPIIFILISGGQVDLTYARDSPSVGAILWAGYPGQSGGDAIADVLFGAFNPAGRLPITSYPSEYVNQVSMFDMNFRPSDPPTTNPGRTYRFFTGQPVFEFGFGLSYTTFRYDWEATMEKEMEQKQFVWAINDLAVAESDRVQLISYRVRVTNIGNRGGDEVVMAYISPQIDVLLTPRWTEKVLTDMDADLDVHRMRSDAPIKQLFGFERIHLCVSQEKEVFFTVTVRNLLSVARDGSHWLMPGDFEVTFGNEGKLKHRIRLKGKPRLWAERVGKQ